MEPLTTLLDAIAVTSTGAIATLGINDAYMAIKETMQKIWKGHPDEQVAESTLAKYEKDPETWKASLSKYLRQFGMDQDQALLAQAENLLTLVRQTQPMVRSVRVGDLKGIRRSTINIAGGSITHVNKPDPSQE